jgi:hypothetical protein
MTTLSNSIVLFRREPNLPAGLFVRRFCLPLLTAKEQVQSRGGWISIRPLCGTP